MSDYISRQAAIDAFYVQSDDDGWWCGTAQDAEELLKGLPYAQPEQRWIPCSERLPEHYDWYLVSNKETSWVALWKDGVFFSVSGYFEFSDIIAWMPLPAPYYEEDDAEIQG